MDRVEDNHHEVAHKPAGTWENLPVRLTVMLAGLLTLVWVAMLGWGLVALVGAL